MRGTAGPGSPEEIARAPEPERWRTLLPAVRGIALRLLRAGRIDVLRTGRPVAGTGLRGVIRLRQRA